MSKSFIRDKNGAMVDSANVTLPTNRNFRDSWVQDGDVLKVDMAAAKVEFKQKIREAIRDKMQNEIIADFIDADLDNDLPAKQALRILRNDGRAALNDGLIQDALSPESLIAVWDLYVDTLGPNPYNRR